MATTKKAGKKKAASKKKRAISRISKLPRPQILIKAPGGKFFVLTLKQLEECAGRNEDWADEVINAYKEGKLKLYTCEIGDEKEDGGVDDWDVWPTNK